MGSVRRRAKLYGDRSNCCRFIDFWIWRLAAILDLLYACLDHKRRVFGGLYSFAEFGWNRCMWVWLENADVCPFLYSSGFWLHKWEVISTSLNLRRTHPSVSNWQSLLSMCENALLCLNMCLNVGTAVCRLPVLVHDIDRNVGNGNLMANNG